MSEVEYDRLSQPDQACETWYCHVCSLPQFTGSFFDEPSTGTVAPSDITSDTAFAAHKGLKLVHLNINSLLDNLDEFRLFLHHYRVDFLVLTETKLDDSVSSNEISIPCYTVAGRRDRTRHGGCVICYVRSHSQAKPLMNSGMKTAEYMWTEIRAGRHRPFVVGGLYRMPSASTTKFIVELDDELQRLPLENTETYLLGDFNLYVCTQRGTAWASPVHRRPRTASTD